MLQGSDVISSFSSLFVRFFLIHLFKQKVDLTSPNVGTLLKHV